MTRPVLMLPKRPPYAVSTVSLAAAGLALSIISVAVFYTIRLFPVSEKLVPGWDVPSTIGNMVASMLAAFVVLVAAFVLVLSAVVNETRRIQHEHVIVEYSRITGDRRYLPYIMPRHTREVMILTVLAAVGPAATVIVELLHFTGAVK